MYQDMPDTSRIRTSLTLKGPRLPASGSAGSDAFGSGPWPAVSHQLGALVVEDDQVLVGFEEINALAGEEPGDTEPGSAHLDDSVGGDRGAADPIPADKADLVSWPRRVGFRCRIPVLLRGDSAGQTLICSYLSAALLVGLLLNSLLGWAWADSIAALLIAGFAIKEGLEAWKGDTCVVPISALTGQREVEACDCC